MRSKDAVQGASAPGSPAEAQQWATGAAGFTVGKHRPYHARRHRAGAAGCSTARVQYGGGKGGAAACLFCSRRSASCSSTREEGFSPPLLPPHTGLNRIRSPANLIDKARKTRVFLIQASDNRLLSDRAIAHHGGLGAAIYVDGDRTDPAVPG